MTVPDFSAAHAVLQARERRLSLHVRVASARFGGP